MVDFIRGFDKTIIHTIRRISIPAARIAIAVIFIWFGMLKVVAHSPANELVDDLLKTMLPNMAVSSFIIFFGLFEVAIGMLFLVPRCERLAIFLLIAHMAMTFLPFVFLPGRVWNGAFQPSLEGQYIIKNIAIIALALGVAAHLHPAKERVG